MSLGSHMKAVVAAIFTLFASHSLAHSDSSYFYSKHDGDTEQTIKIAAIDWCPQICPKQRQQGYVIELIKQVFKDSPYHLRIDYFPWSRAIKNVLTGQYQALLAPAKAEAPQLRYPHTPVGQQAMCFFTKNDSQWRYDGVSSLKDKQIGIAIDTSIEELNDFVERHPEQFQYQPYHERYITQNAKKLDKNRIDAFLFTYNSTRYELTQNGIWHNYRSAGCVSSADIFLAFTPEQGQSHQVSEQMTFFDMKMEQMNHTLIKEQLLDLYGLK